MSYQTSQEEADQQWPLDLQFVLVGFGCHGEPNEEEEATNEQRWIVRIEDSPGHEEQVSDCDPTWNRIFTVFPLDWSIGIRMIHQSQPFSGWQTHS